MAQDHTNDNIEPFYVFNYTQNSVSKCTQAMNTRPSLNQSDSKSNELCCNEVQCCFCWPIILLVDILSCPFRGCMHLKKTRCNSSNK
jgi:hypothetical protein